jgi:archaellum component FlaC
MAYVVRAINVDGVTGTFRAEKNIRTDVRDQIGGLRTEVHDEIGEVHDQIGGLRKEMHEGFAAINRRLDQIIQMQLDEHAARIKKLETAEPLAKRLVLSGLGALLGPAGRP